MTTGIEETSSNPTEEVVETARTLKRYLIISLGDFTGYRILFFSQESERAGCLNPRI